LVIYLYELNIRELFEIQSQRARNRVKGAVRLTGTFQINVRNAVSKFKFAVACKAVQDQSKVLVALHITGAFKEFVQDGTNNNS